VDISGKIGGSEDKVQVQAELPWRSQLKKKSPSLVAAPTPVNDAELVSNFNIFLQNVDLNFCNLFNYNGMMLFRESTITK
jgi:hypothetical protein